MDITPSQYCKIGKEFLPATSSVRKLPIGEYDLQNTDKNGIPMYTPISKSYCGIPMEASDTIVKEILEFYTNTEPYKKYGIPYRKGILVYGHSGSGKSVIINQCIQSLLKYKVTAIHADVNPEVTFNALSFMKKIEPNKCAVCVIKDIADIMERFGKDSLINLLESYEYPGVVFIGESCLLNEQMRYQLYRCGRFDRFVRTSDTIDIKVIEQFIRNNTCIKEEEKISRIRGSIANFSFRALTDLCVKINTFGGDMEKISSVIKDMKDINTGIFQKEERKKVGF